MGIYKYLRNAWKSPSDEQEKLNRDRLVSWRREPVTLRIERPTRLDRARSLGYKAKEGFIVVRQRVDRGGRMRPNDRGGRRPKANRLFKVVKTNYQSIAERRAARNFTNCEVLSSYPVGEDGKHYWFEVVMVERSHPNIVSDVNLARLVSQRGRAFRGLTSAGRKGRGL